MEIVVAPDAETAAVEAASLIARRLRGAVRRRGRATVAFSGGTTPALMLGALAADQSVPWQHVVVYQVDERVAPDGDPARNASLLDVLPVARRNLVLLPVTAPDLAAAARRYARRLPERLDVVHLGLGDDGHTASWPPGEVPAEAERAVVVTAPYAGFRRLTLTPAPVNAAVSRVLLATGGGKSAAVRGWLLGDASLPVQAVRRSGTVVVVDAAAAAALPLGTR